MASNLTAMGSSVKDVSATDEAFRERRRGVKHRDVAEAPFAALSPG